MEGVVLLLAAGGGARLGCGPKAFVEVGGIPILRRAAECVRAQSIVVAVPRDDIDRARDVLLGIPCTVVEGGATRQESAAMALRAAGEPDAVAVHDAARALCPPELFDRCFEGLETAEAVVCAVPLRDTVKEVKDGVVTRTIDRSVLWAAQTPQAFRTDVYARAHAVAARDGFTGTDDVALVERIGVKVRVIEGSERNIKITTPSDLALAEAMVR